MPLFDDKERNDLSLRKHAEPWYSFLDRTCNNAFEQVRQLCDRLYDNLAKEKQADIKGRFCSGDDSALCGAFLVMFLNELLIFLKCDVTPEPETDKGTRPEYEVKPPNGQPFILEAKTVTGESSDDAASNRREKQLYDSLDNIVISPDFFLKIQIHGYPESNPPVKRLIKEL